MSRKLLKIITGVAAAITMVILIAVITAVMITTVNQDNALENKDRTKAKQIDVLKKQDNVVNNQDTMFGTQDGQTKTTGILIKGIPFWARVA